MSVFGWSYPAGAENDPNAPWNQDDEEDVDDDGEYFVAECGAKFVTRAGLLQHCRYCKACRYDHDCDRADLLRKELKEDGGHID